MGYHRAGFEVTGVDIAPQPRYPHAFVQADAIEYLTEHGHEYDAIHASPPCQRYSVTHVIRGREHPDLIAAVRAAIPPGTPYVIENVTGAAAHLRDPLMLCGTMFALRTYRHRLFETGGFTAAAPAHPRHTAPVARMGRPVRDGEFIHIVGNFSGADLAREVMDMPWASRDGLRDAIPPAYTDHIGRQLIEHLATQEAVA